MDGVFMNISPSYQAPKFKVGDIVTNGCGIYTIGRVGSQYGSYDRQSYDYVGGGFDYESILKPINPVVLTELRNGRFIEAIKVYREVHGVGLKEAKEVCESIRDLLPPVAAPKFKVGDKVKHRTEAVGVGTVLGEGSSSGYWRVEWNTWHGDCTDPESDLIPVKTGTFIVAVFERGQYQPSANPFIHADESAAVAEAERLSRKHVGQKFGTFALIADSVTPPSDTKTVRV